MEGGGEDDSWRTLSRNDKIDHKNWKARVAGYEELKKDLAMMDDEKDFRRISDIIKKTPMDANASAQEKGLECALEFLKNAPQIGSEIGSDVVDAIVNKALTARPKNKQLGYDILMQFIENENCPFLSESLSKGLDAKNPKIVGGSTEIVFIILRDFGAQSVDLKSFLRIAIKALQLTDKNARAFGKSIMIEAFKWIRDAVRAQINSSGLNPVIIKELETEFDNLANEPTPTPTRMTKTAQLKAESGETGGEGGDQAGGGIAEVDPLDFIDAVDIGAQLSSSSFFTDIVETKWQARKGALEELLKLVSAPKIAESDFSELIGCLKKVIASDTNINVATAAINCVAALAKGLRTSFGQYAQTILAPILEKFKEKKANVVAALRDAADNTFKSAPSISLLADCAFGLLESKNPAIREEVTKFCGRALLMIKAKFSKSDVKMISEALLKPMDDSVGPVREAGAEALASLGKVATLNVLNVFIESLDDIKKNKIKDTFNNLFGGGTAAGRTSAIPVTKAAATAATPSKPTTPVAGSAAASKLPSVSKSNISKPTATNAPATAKPSTTAKPAGKSSGDSFSADQDDPADQPLDEVAAVEKGSQFLSEEILNNMVASDWKVRVEAFTALLNHLESAEESAIDPLTVYGLLSRKPGWKDANFNSLKTRYQVLLLVLKKCKNISKTIPHDLVNFICDKITDVKVKDTLKEVLVELSLVNSLNYIGVRILRFIKSSKNIKAQIEILNWMRDMLFDFGLKIDIKHYLVSLKPILDVTNPELKKTCILFFVRMGQFMGPAMSALLSSTCDMKPAQLQQYDDEYNKVKGEAIPKPKYGAADAGNDANEGSAGGGSIPTLEDLIERADLSQTFDSSFIDSLNDKNWKVRSECLEKLCSSTAANKFINGSTLGSIINTGLKPRLSDSNKNLITSALNIFNNLFQNCSLSDLTSSAFVGVIRPIAEVSGDSKPQLKNLVATVLTSYVQKVPFNKDNQLMEIIAETICEFENIHCRSTLLNWLVDITKSCASEMQQSHIDLLIKPTIAAMQDKNADVRKAAQSLVEANKVSFNCPLLYTEIGNIKITANRTNVQSVLNKIGVSQHEFALKNAATSGIDDDKSASKASSKSSKAGSTKYDPRKAAATAAKSKTTNAEDSSAASTAKSSNPKSTISKDVLNINSADIKSRRAISEREGRLLRWNFTSVRPEYVKHLKELFSKDFSNDFILPAFSTDGKKHMLFCELVFDYLKGKYGLSEKNKVTIVDSELSTDHQLFDNSVTEMDPSKSYYIVDSNSNAKFFHSKCLTICNNFDLILKWATLRLFDPNQTIVIGVLEAMMQMINIFATFNLKLTNYELEIFLPTLMNKLGDPKDPIRLCAKSTFCCVLTNIDPTDVSVDFYLKLCNNLIVSSKVARSRFEVMLQVMLLYYRIKPGFDLEFQTEFDDQKHLDPFFSSEESIDVIKPLLLSMCYQILPNIIKLPQDRDVPTRKTSLELIVLFYSAFEDLNMDKYLSTLSKREQDPIIDQLNIIDNKRKAYKILELEKSKLNDEASKNNVSSNQSASTATSADDKKDGTSSSRPKVEKVTFVTSKVNIDQFKTQYKEDMLEPCNVYLVSHIENNLNEKLTLKPSIDERISILESFETTKTHVVVSELAKIIDEMSRISLSPNDSKTSATFLKLFKLVLLNPINLHTEILAKLILLVFKIVDNFNAENVESYLNNLCSQFLSWLLKLNQISTTFEALGMLVKSNIEYLEMATKCLWKSIQSFRNPVIARFVDTDKLFTCLLQFYQTYQLLGKLNILEDMLSTCTYLPILKTYMGQKMCDEQFKMWLSQKVDSNSRQHKVQDYQHYLEHMVKDYSDPQMFFANIQTSAILLYDPTLNDEVENIRHMLSQKSKQNLFIFESALTIFSNSLEWFIDSKMYETSPQIFLNEVMSLKALSSESTVKLSNSANSPKLDTTNFFSNENLFNKSLKNISSPSGSPNPSNKSSAKLTTNNDASIDDLKKRLNTLRQKR